jgi:hypothetical protein
MSASYSKAVLKDPLHATFSTFKGPLLSLNFDEKPIRIPLSKLKNRYTNFEAGVRRKQNRNPPILYVLGAFLVGCICLFIYVDLRQYYHPELTNLYGLKRSSETGGSLAVDGDAQSRKQQRQQAR